jgi:hypothetical protein
MLVNIGSFELIQLMTFETINRSAGHNSDLDTFAVEYFPSTIRSPVEHREESAKVAPVSTR